MPVVRVEDPADLAVAPFVGLTDHEARRVREKPGGDMSAWFLAEGDVVIGRALAAGHVLEDVLVDARRAVPDVVPTATTVLAAGAEVLVAVCGRPALRDAIARFRRPAPVPADSLLTVARSVVVTEAVHNPTNMGVIARCAAGLGMDALLVDPTSCDPLYRRAVRVSMGEVFAVAHARLGALPDGLAPLRAAGFRVLALTPGPDARDIADLRLRADERIALVVGSEGPGLTDATLDAADGRVCIPMAAGVDSLNVASAVAIACQAVRVARRRHGSSRQ